MSTEPSADEARQIAGLSSDLFHSFPAEPPSASAVLDKAYDVLNRHATFGRFCDRCFTPEQQRMVLRGGDLRHKPPGEFRDIYFEHPECSVGADGMFYFLPRALETLMFDSDLAGQIIGYSAKCGLYSRPEADQGVLREFFARAAHGWFAARDPAPLGRWDASAGMARQRPGGLAEQQCTEDIVSALLHLRVAPREVFAWLRDLNTPFAWRSLCHLLTSGPLLEAEIYYVVERGRDEMYAEMARVLDRIARTELFEAITKDALNTAWETIGMDDQELYDVFRYADGLYTGCAVTRSGDEKLADLRLLQDLAIELMD